MLHRLLFIRANVIRSTSAFGCRGGRFTRGNTIATAAAISLATASPVLRPPPIARFGFRFSPYHGNIGIDGFREIWRRST